MYKSFLDYPMLFLACSMMLPVIMWISLFTMITLCSITITGVMAMVMTVQRNGSMLISWGKRLFVVLWTESETFST